MDIRTLVLGLGVFCATFLVGWWLNIGAFVYGTGTSTSQARPAAMVAVPAMGTTGQGSAAPALRPVVHVQTSAPQAKPAQPKLPQVKSAQSKDPQAQSQPGKAGPRRTFRFRRR